MADGPPPPVLRAYVTCGGSPGTVVHFDVDELTDRLVAYTDTLATDLDPEAAVLSPDGTWLYVANFASADLSGYQIDATTGRLTAAGTTPCDPTVSPKALRIDPTGSLMAVASRGTQLSGVQVMLRNPATGALTAGGVAASDPGSLVRDVAIVGAEVVTANWYTPTLTQFSVGPDGSLGPAVSIGTIAGPDALAIDATSTHLYVAGSYIDEVGLHTIEADGTIDPLGPAVPAPSNPTGIALNASGTAAYAVGWDSGNVVSYEVDPSTGTLTSLSATVTGANPGAVAVDPSGHYVLTSTFTGQDVWLYSIAANGSLTMADRETPCAAQSATSVSVLRSPS